MKIIVAHPSKQHSLHSAYSIKKSGNLLKYITTVYDRKGSLTSFIKHFSGARLRKKIETHKTDLLDDDEIIQFYEFDYIISLFLNRFPRFKVLREKHRQYVANKFGRKVASYAIKNDADAVIMYDSTAKSCFDILKKKKPSIRRILDVSIASRPYMKFNFEEDIKRTNNNSLKEEFPLLWNDSYMRDCTDEFELASDFIVPSNVVKDSLMFCNVDKNNIKVVPYGVDIDKFAYIESHDATLPLKLIYVGQISYRKGIHHLLNVASKMNDCIAVDLVGDYSKSNPLYIEGKTIPNVSFSGFVTRDKLAKKYQEADAFIFPTLGEGYGLVVLEAMACGLPILCSDLAGGNDAVIDGYNGYVFSGGNEAEMEECIMKLVSDKASIVTMGSNARKTAEGLTWDTYYDSYSETVLNMIGGEKDEYNRSEQDIN
ncbi:MAG: glycosyltransferase family 4 protein [Oscillospiraceae bacterium]|nr:glycosyltransferase family 4 protein [Oscillospiraceae bacterium]